MGLDVTNDDLLSGNAAECWKCHYRWWCEGSMSCPSCNTPLGEADADMDNPYFIIDLNIGVSYMGGIVAFPTKQLRDDYAKTLSLSNVLFCEVTGSHHVDV